MSDELGVSAEEVVGENSAHAPEVDEEVAELEALEVADEAAEEVSEV